MARYIAPLAEKLEDELVRAVQKDQDDAAECRAELHSRGWKDEWIDDPQIFAKMARVGRES